MRTTRQQVLLETHAARQRAADLLKTLQAAQMECEGQLKADQRADVVKVVTGQSSIEAAIVSTRRMIETLDRALEEARNSLCDADQDLLDEIEDADLTVHVPAGGGCGGGCGCAGKIGNESAALRQWA